LQSDNDEVFVFMDITSLGCIFVFNDYCVFDVPRRLVYFEIITFREMIGIAVVNYAFKRVATTRKLDTADATPH
jgi:hypothetical protein